MPAQTSGHFTSANWDEHPLGPEEVTPRLTRASVTNTFSGGIQATGTTCEYTIVYLADKSGTFTGLEVLTGTLDGRRGSFAIEERGTFDDNGTLRCTFEIVPGSGTEQLAGLYGSGSFTTTPGDPSIPYTLAYDLG